MGANQKTGKLPGCFGKIQTSRSFNMPSDLHSPIDQTGTNRGSRPALLHNEEEEGAAQPQAQARGLEMRCQGGFCRRARPRIDWGADELHLYLFPDVSSVPQISQLSLNSLVDDWTTACPKVDFSLRVRPLCCDALFCCASRSYFVSVQGRFSCS